MRWQVGRHDFCLRSEILIVGYNFQLTGSMLCNNLEFNTDFLTTREIRRLLEKIGLKDKIYAHDNEFRLLQLDTGPQWLSDASGMDRTRWERFRFDVWSKKFLGWLDIFIGRDGHSGWHFFEHDPDNPDKGVLVYYAPMKVDPNPAARPEIFKLVCEYVKKCHEWTLSEMRLGNKLDWKTPTTPLKERV